MFLRLVGGLQETGLSDTGTHATRATRGGGVCAPTASCTCNKRGWRLCSYRILCVCVCVCVTLGTLLKEV